MTEKIFIGVDPGASGAIAILNAAGEVVEVIRSDMTEHDVASELWNQINDCDCSAVIERVSSMPKQGVSSTFKFGMSYGFLRGLLVAMQIPFTEVTPSAWQKEMGCRTKGDKNVSKAAAQKRWPSEKIIHRTADALLIAEYCRVTHR